MRIKDRSSDVCSSDLRIVPQFLIFARVLVEGQDPAADRIAGGVVTAHDQQQQITEKFQEGHVAGRRGMRHRRYQVVAAGLVDPLVPQALEIHRALDEFLATLLKRFNYASLWRCGGDIRPTCELGPFLPGKIENRRKRPGGRSEARREGEE